jgi:uncharacterized RDD family membrane protein YckC
VTRILAAIPQPSRQPQSCWQLVALLPLLPALAAAQPVGPPSTVQQQQIRIAATERSLWLAAITGSGSRLFFRGAAGGFDLGRSTSRRIETMAALDRDLLVFFDDAAVYRYLPDTTARPTAEAVLPQNQLPLDIVGEAGVAYAIIPSAAAAELPPVATDDVTPTSQPFDPGSAPLSAVRYDGRTWNAIAPLPPLVRRATDARLQPRLCLVNAKLFLLTTAEPPGRILCFHYNAKSEQWVSRGTIDVPQLAGFWAVNLNRVPTLVTVSQSPTGREGMSAYQLRRTDPQADATAWRPADLKLSDLPEGIAPARYTGAVGFNQHLGLLAVDASGETYLRFARITAPPAEPTLPVANLLAQPGIMRHTRGLVQKLTFILLLGVLAGLFVFRRGSMVKPIELPPGCALAFNLQRMFGWLIDFAPFALAGTIILDVSWSEGLWKLAEWGIKPDPQRGEPKQDVLLWWAFSVVCYTTYALLLELLIGRTPGKYFARVYLLSESGKRPTAWQILTRNLTRLIELTPQFWIFVVLVLLSRNRQRMGDIFARTVAIRLTPVQPPISDRKTAGTSDEQPSEPVGDKSRTQPDSDESEPSDAEAPEAENEDSSGPSSDQRPSSKPRDEEE